MSDRLPWVAYPTFFLAIAFGAYLLLTSAAQRAVLRSRLLVAPQVPGMSPRTHPFLSRLLPASALARLQAAYERRRREKNLSFTWHQYLAVCLGLGMFAGLIGALQLQSLPAAMLLFILGVILPDRIIAVSGGGGEDLLHEQLQLVLHLFAGDYREHRSVARAFARTARRNLPDPIRTYFSRAARRLNSSEDPALVLNDLARTLQDPYARMFCSNCLQLYHRQESQALFDDIAHQLMQYRVRRRRRFAALHAGKLASLVVLALLPVIYVVNMYVQPLTHEFLTTSLPGRILVVLILASVVMTVILNQVLVRGE